MKLITYLSRKVSSLLNKKRCTCLKEGECDCQNPEPDEGGIGGVWHYSNECPVHNLFPDPNPTCPVHGEMSC